jgi:hypothetical protein
MSVGSKIIIVVLTILSIFCIGFSIYEHFQIQTQNIAIQNSLIEMKRLQDGLVVSSNQYISKDDLNKFIQQNTNDLKAIQDNLASLGAQITAANVVTADSKGQIATNISSTSTTPSGAIPLSPTVIPCPSGGSVTCPSADPLGYQTNVQILALNEDFATIKVPFGSVSFNASQPAPWSVNVAPREYKITSVIGTDENQRVYVDNKFTIQEGDKNYVVPIKTAQTEQVYPSPKFYWWNPQLVAGIDAGMSLSRFPQIQGEVAPSLNLGIMSYGKFKNQPDISVLQVGAAYEATTQHPALVVTPVAVNLGTVLPLLHNTYVAPSIHVSTDGTVFGALGLRLQL